MDQLHLMTVFVAVAEEQGFAAASRRLKLSPPAVTRAITALEEKLGVRLLNRTTRYVRVTEAGQRYLDDARRILHDVDMANEAAIGISAEPKGHLSITAPVLFGQKHIIPGIVAYLTQFPETQIDAVFLDRVVNLLEEGFDVGIRIGQLPDSTLYAVPVGKVRLLLVASPDYLKKYGTPQTPNELRQHLLIASNAGSMTPDWHFQQHKSKTSLQIQPRLTVTSNQAAINAATQHLGITRVISYQVNDELKTGSLKRVLADFELPDMPIHVIYREGRMASTKIRSFVDFIVQRLRADKSLN